MLDLVTEVDGRPLSRWGCDGLVFATPTGSTAYAFSAGGPVVWPDVEALLLVPISAHALFAGPMVVSPESVLAAEVIGATGGHGEVSGAVLWCDGRRTVDLPPGARVEVRRGAQPVLLARLRHGPAGGGGPADLAARSVRADLAAIGASFTDRLVAKFGLPVAGWRGRAEARQDAAGAAGETRSRQAMLEEVRISGLGVIDEAVLELSSGFNVVTGETGAGKTMVVSGLGLLFGGRADPSRIRPGADRATVEGPAADRPGRRGRQAGQRRRRRPGRRRRRRWCWSGRSPRRARSRAFAGGRSVPVSLLTYLSDDLVAVHGQADQQQLLKPGRQRQALDRFAGTELGRMLGDYQRAYQQHLKVAAELAELTSLARERAAEADDLRHGLAEIERLEPADGEDLELHAEAERLSNADTLHSAATTAHEALISDPSSASYESADALSLARRRLQRTGAGGRRCDATIPGARRPARPAARLTRGRPLPASADIRRPSWPELSAYGTTGSARRFAVEQPTRSGSAPPRADRRGARRSGGGATSLLPD